MSQQSTMSRVSQKPFHCINGSRNVVNPDHCPSRLVLLKLGVKGRKVVINSLFIVLALAPSKMKAQCIEVKLPLYTNNFSFPQALQFGGKKQLYGVGNSIEFIKPVPGERPLVANHSPKPKEIRVQMNTIRGGLVLNSKTNSVQMLPINSGDSF
ncbi:hypothetical protein [Klebsiella pneumoniae]|uniref:hypothetical protein n=1 Tax=Klebsiella pneumoniae TaxID=573 RepID=UPI0011E49A5A|nr:hypothetical protein [Klebsiella pneumoniae]TYE07109.1 hypothetical protein DJ500_20225 [Klebsiella pneumoniae]TYE17192.1 hypothetical protein DJ510_20880 [Klebsiella pneumoniae]